MFHVHTIIITSECINAIYNYTREYIVNHKYMCIILNIIMTSYIMFMYTITITIIMVHA